MIAIAGGVSIIVLLVFGWTKASLSQDEILLIIAVAMISSGVSSLVDSWRPTPTREAVQGGGKEPADASS